jgi:hypothetical protein
MKKTITISILALLIIPVITATATDSGVMNFEFEEISEYRISQTYIFDSDYKNELPLVENTGQAPNKPIIIGPTIGTIGKIYTYKISAIDPQGDDVYYKISWGDCSVIYWDGPHESGEELIYDHAWCSVCYPGGGDFTIQVSVKDANGNIGPYETLDIIMNENGINQQINLRTSYRLILNELMELFPILNILLDY